MQTTEAEQRTHLILQRRRWANVAAIYSFLLLFSIMFMGPFVFALLSSVKDNPTEWPPTLAVSQLKPGNWASAFRMAREGGGSGLFGQFAPGAYIPFEVTYRVGQGQEPSPPDVVIPRRLPTQAAMALRTEYFAADYAQVSEVEETGRVFEEDGSVLVTYQFSIEHTGDIAVDRLPLDLTVPMRQEFVSGTLDPNRIERLGRVQSWNNITAGIIPYVFHNYTRVFQENYSRSTGRGLFLQWMGNSFFLAIVRVITTLIFASAAGYALARLKFFGNYAIFLFMLFSMMIPAQVTFISNYLVLRDGVFGLSRLFGYDSLLNTYAGLIVSGLVGANAVFIMKQFFERMPKSLEESARIDGASTYQIFFQIMLPLARPPMGALTILTFQGVWNEFFWPLVVITAPQDRFPLTIGLLSLRRTYGAAAFDWGPILAGTFISALPIVILFIVFQKYFVEGISFSGQKG